MSSVRHDVIVETGMNNSGLASGIRQANHMMKEGFSEFGKELIGGFSIAGVVAGIEKAFQRVSEIQNTAARSGLGAEALQKLDYAAEQLHIPIEAANNGFDKLNLKIGQAKNGIGKAAEGFERWGIALNGKTTEEIIGQIADKMKSLADPADRAALAFDTMGRGGATLIPLLERGSVAMAAMAKNASIFTEKDIEAIESAHQSIAAISNTLLIYTGKLITAISSYYQFLGNVEAAMERIFQKRNFKALLNPLGELKKEMDNGKGTEESKKSPGGEATGENGSGVEGDDTGGGSGHGGTPSDRMAALYAKRLAAQRAFNGLDLGKHDIAHEKRVADDLTRVNKDIADALQEEKDADESKTPTGKLKVEFRKASEELKKRSSAPLNTIGPKQMGEINALGDKVKGLQMAIKDSEAGDLAKLAGHAKATTTAIEGIAKQASPTGPGLKMFVP